MYKVLVIDDDDHLRRTVAHCLQRNGLRVLEAATGIQGVGIARQQVPDLVLCDLDMEGADGAATLELMRNDPLTAEIPFLLMTGHAEHPSTVRSEKLLTKPFTLPKLLAAVWTSLDQKKKSQVKPDAKGNRVTPSRRNAPGPVPRTVSLKRASKASPEQLEALSTRLQSLLEMERSRIARVIHDELTQKLTVLSLELSFLDSSLTGAGESPLPQYQENIRKLSQLLTLVIESAQTITAELRPKVLDEFGLVAGLEWLAAQFEKKTGLRCELRGTESDVALSPHVATELYRLAEEALQNVAQHAKASAVSISVERCPRGVSMRIKDDGKGITARQIHHPDSLGLLAMRNRTEALGGTFEITGSPQKGTAVLAHIPLKPN